MTEFLPRIRNEKSSSLPLSHYQHHHHRRLYREHLILKLFNVPAVAVNFSSETFPDFQLLYEHNEIIVYAIETIRAEHIGAGM